MWILDLFLYLLHLDHVAGIVQTKHIRDRKHTMSARKTEQKHMWSNITDRLRRPLLSRGLVHFVCLFVRSIDCVFARVFVSLFLCSFVGSCFCLFVCSPVRLFVCLFLHSFDRAPVQSRVRWFVGPPARACMRACRHTRISRMHRRPRPTHQRPKDVVCLNRPTSIMCKYKQQSTTKVLTSG